MLGEIVSVDPWASYGHLGALPKVKFKEALEDYQWAMSGRRIAHVGYHFNGTGLIGLIENHFKVGFYEKSNGMKFTTITYTGVPYVIEVETRHPGFEVFIITESY